MNAVEACHPMCPGCWNQFEYRREMYFGLYWMICRCGWRGLVRFWREQA